MLQSDKVPLELLRSTAAQFMATSQLLSINESVFVDSMTSHVNTDFESNHPPITALQVDKTPLDILRYQATQFVPLMALGALQDKLVLLGVKLDASVDSANAQHPIALLPTSTQAIEMLRHKVANFEAAKALLSIRDSLFTPRPTLVPPQVPIELLQTDTVPLAVLRNTAVQLTTATQFLSINESVFVHGMTSHTNTDFESSHPPVIALQIDKTPLQLLKEQAKQFTTTAALWQLSRLPQSTLCLQHQKQQSSMPYQTLERLTTTPEPLRYLAEQGRELAEYNALECLSEYLQTLAPSLRTRPATLQKLEAHPDLLQTMQDSAADVIEYDALYTIWQELYQQVERHKALKIQTEEAQRHSERNVLFQLPFLKLTDDFRTECANIVRGLLEQARRDQHDDTNTLEAPQTLEARQEDTYTDEADAPNDMPYIGI